MIIRGFIALSIISAFIIISCSSKEENEIQESEILETNEVVTDIQDDSLKPNSTGVLTFTPTAEAHQTSRALRICCSAHTVVGLDE